MSNETKIYGYIEVPILTGNDVEAAIAMNQKAIDELPVEGEWPWLVRDMFSLAPKSVSYRGCLFHFAAAIKGVDEAWGKWLSNFEALLKRMYWITAELRLITEYSGNHTYTWAAELPDEIIPVTDWEFIGEQRSFDHIYKKKI